MKTKNIFLIMTMLVVGVVLSACNAQAKDAISPISPPIIANTAIMAEGTLVPRDFAYLAFQAHGEITEIFVQEGDQVQSGDLLARLGNAEPFEAQLAAAEIELVAAEQALNDLYDNTDLAASAAQQRKLDAERALISAKEQFDRIDLTAHNNDIDDAVITINEQLTIFKEAQVDFEPYQNLAVDNTTRQDFADALDQAQKDYNAAVRAHDMLVLNFDQAQASLQAAEAGLAAAERDVAAWQDGPDPDQVILLEKRLAATQAQVAAAQAALDNLQITAPFSGTIVQVYINLNENVTLAQPAFLLADFSSWYVETSDLTEIEVVKIVGIQDVSIQPDALSDALLTGTVESISDVFEIRRGDVTYTARILIDDFDLPLRWGMSMIVTFEP